MQLKTIDLNSPTFTANGKTYFIESSLSLQRYAKFEEIEIELGFSRSFAEVFDNVRAAMNDINAHKQGDAYVKLYNIINGVQQLQNKKAHVFRACALFINEENENRAVINEDMITRKVNDWEVEGLDYQPFFTLAIGFLNGFKERYKKVIQDFSPTKN